VRPPPPADTFRRSDVRSPDGTRIACYVGGLERSAHTVLVAGDPTAPSGLWQHQLSYLGDRLRFVTWDWRGQCGSETPEPRAGRYTVNAQLDDLRAVIDAVVPAEQPLTLLGFGVGAQLAIEAYRERRDQVRAMVFIAAAAGRPLADLALRASALPIALSWATASNGHAPRLTRLARRWSMTMLRRMAARSHDAEVCRTVAAAVDELQVDAYLSCLHSLATHDAFDELSRIEIPTLVIAGGQDRLTPPAVTHQLARHLPHSRITLVPRAQHPVFLEYPDLVNLELEQFFEHVGTC
jgi:pimeloyl-ACP methyl ester carboxylesterase